MMRRVFCDKKFK